MGEVERTFLMIKPDGVQRNLVGEIVKRAEQKGLKLLALKLLQLDRETAEKHYAEHRNKVFFDSLVDYVMSGPSVAMVLGGKDAIPTVRNMIGATDPVDARRGTIRGDYALDIGRNVVHAADSPDAAKNEIALYFEENEILDYERVDEAWLYE